MLRTNQYPGRSRLAAGMIAGAAVLGPLTACGSGDSPSGEYSAVPTEGSLKDAEVQCEARQVGHVVLSGAVREAALKGEFPAEIDTLDDRPFELILALVPEDATLEEYNEDSLIFETVLNRLMPPPTVLATRHPLPEIQPGNMHIVTLEMDSDCPLTAPDETLPQV